MNPSKLAESNRFADDSRETAHAARNRAAVDAYTFSLWAASEARRNPTDRTLEIASKAAKVADLASKVCL